MAVAYAGQTLGLTTHVFIPRDASKRKIALARNYTPNVVLTDCDFDAAKELAKELAEKNGFYFIDDGGEDSIAEGAGTIALEILERRTPTAVVVDRKSTRLNSSH